MQYKCGTKYWSGQLPTEIFSLFNYFLLNSIENLARNNWILLLLSTTEYVVERRRVESYWFNFTSVWYRIFFCYSLKNLQLLLTLFFLWVLISFECFSKFSITYSLPWLVTLLFPEFWLFSFVLQHIFYYIYFTIVSSSIFSLISDLSHFLCVFQQMFHFVPFALVANSTYWVLIFFTLQQIFHYVFIAILGNYFFCDFWSLFCVSTNFSLCIFCHCW